MIPANDAGQRLEIGSDVDWVEIAWINGRPSSRARVTAEGSPAPGPNVVDWVDIGESKARRAEMVERWPCAWSTSGVQSPAG